MRKGPKPKSTKQLQASNSSRQYISPKQKSVQKLTPDGVSRYEYLKSIWLEKRDTMKVTQLVLLEKRLADLESMMREEELSAEQAIKDDPRNKYF